MLLCVLVAHFFLLLSGSPRHQSLSMPQVKDIKVASGLGDYKSTTSLCEHNFSFHLGKHLSKYLLKKKKKHISGGTRSRVRLSRGLQVLSHMVSLCLTRN